MLNVVLSAMLLTATQAIPETLLAEGESLPGPAGSFASRVLNVELNQVGDYALYVVRDDSTGALDGLYWGSLGGAAPAVLRVEQNLGGLQQVSLGTFFGLSDTGNLTYPGRIEDPGGGAFPLDALWLDDVNLWVEEDAVPTVAGKLWSFLVRGSITSSGVPVWQAAMNDVPNTASDQRGLFMGVGATPVLLGGDTVAGLPEPLAKSAITNGITPQWDFSPDGGHYIAHVQMDFNSFANNTIVLDDAGLTAGGSLMREGDFIPAAAGGLVNMLYWSFGDVSVNNAGSWAVTGSVVNSGPIEGVLYQDGQITRREGDVVDGRMLVSDPFVGLDLNAEGDLAYGWPTVSPLVKETLFVDDQAVVEELDQVDLDNNGVLDLNTSIVTFLFMRLGNRHADGTADLYYIADVSTTSPSSTAELRGAFRSRVNLTFADLGCSTPGVAGNPLLAGSGPLTLGSNNQLNLTGAAPNAFVTLLVSFAPAEIPFAGGTLKVPLTATKVFLTTSATGDVPLSFVRTLDLPSDVSVYVQALIFDPAATQGIALSNAVRIRAP